MLYNTETKRKLCFLFATYSESALKTNRFARRKIVLDTEIPIFKEVFGSN